MHGRQVDNRNPLENCSWRNRESAGKRGERIVRKLFTIIFFLAALFLISSMAGIVGERLRSQIATMPLEVEEKTDDPAESLADAQKISGYAHPEALASVYELNKQILEPNSDIFILDARGGSFQAFQASYRQGHIPGAVPILLSSYSHPIYQERIATPLHLQTLLGGYGINNNTPIIVYANNGLQTRLYWAIKMYGYDNVKILDGGQDKWKEAGYDITPAETRRRPEEFQFDLTKLKMDSMMATLEEVKGAIGNSGCIIVDARTNDEYLYGHIPGSVNIDTKELFSADQTFKPPSDLSAFFEKKNINKEQKIIVYSNSGIRSSLVWFALAELLGFPNVKNYDGSYNEWFRHELPVEGLINVLHPKQDADAK